MRNMLKIAQFLPNCPLWKHERKVNEPLSQEMDQVDEGIPISVKMLRSNMCNRTAGSLDLAERNG
jgi:hypothetical protein